MITRNAFNKIRAEEEIDKIIEHYADWCDKRFNTIINDHGSYDVSFNKQANDKHFRQSIQERVK